MTITLGYATLAAINYRLDFTTGDDATRDAVLEQQVEAISRAIDGITGHRFHTTTADETRYYTAWNEKMCYVDDLLTITTFATDLNGNLDYTQTWATSDYLKMPVNAALDGWPYSWIQLHPMGRYLVPTHTNAVKIVGKFGFCTTGSQPDEITEACLLAVEQLFKRKDAIYGVTGPMGMSFSLKTAMRDDPHIMALLQPYVRMV